MQVTLNHLLEKLLFQIDSQRKSSSVSEKDVNIVIWKSKHGQKHISQMQTKQSKSNLNILLGITQDKMH